jgi:hypothetical protein
MSPLTDAKIDALHTLAASLIEEPDYDSAASSIYPNFPTDWDSPTSLFITFLQHLTLLVVPLL